MGKGFCPQGDARFLQKGAGDDRAQRKDKKSFGGIRNHLSDLCSSLRDRAVRVRRGQRGCLPGKNPGRIFRFFRNDASSVCGKAGKRETHRGASAFPETGPGKADGAADCRRRSAPERTYGEALASGLPLLCRKDDCLKGILREGENGWQYEGAGEFQRFVVDWMALPGGEKEKMRQSARQSAEVFSAESFARKAEAVYEVEKARHRSIQKRHYRE